MKTSLIVNQLKQIMTATKWIIDPTHAEVSFKVKYFIISSVTGFFRKFQGSMESISANFGGAKVNFSAVIDSMDTNQTGRDNHLKSGIFFDAVRYPNVTFVESIKNIGGYYKLIGNLTIKATTTVVVLDLDYSGLAYDLYGQNKAGFEIDEKVNRKEFGLTWSAITEAGSIV